MGIKKNHPACDMTEREKGGLVGGALQSQPIQFSLTAQIHAHSCTHTHTHTHTHTGTVTCSHRKFYPWQRDEKKSNFLQAYATAHTPGYSFTTCIHTHT